MVYVSESDVKFGSCMSYLRQFNLDIWGRINRLDSLFVMISIEHLARCLSYHDFFN